jgi:hypothetical protein
MTGKVSPITMRLVPLSQGVAGPWAALKAEIGAQAAKTWSILSRPSTQLLTLAEVAASCRSLGHSYTGVQQVVLNQILGSASQGRSQDFDANFRPQRAAVKDRCRSIVTARQRGIKMPPIFLVQVGDIYFVEDGHHRISVARAWGEQEIEAKVAAWQVAGALPWKA